MFKKLLIPILLALSCWGEAADTQVPTAIVSQLEQPDLGITQVTLANGMRLCLKPTKFESDEVLIRLTAEGGYAALPPAQRAAGELAAQIAWESGLEGISTDRLEAMIYEHSIEVYAKMLPYHRIFEGTTDREGIELFFDLINRYSNQKQVSREGFDKVVKLVKSSVREREGETRLEDWNRLAHTQNVEALRVLTLRDLEMVEFEHVKKIFEDYFSNPADFVCVIVGDFQIDEILPLVARYLGTISVKGGKTPLPSVAPPTFPEGTLMTRMSMLGRSDCLARLTFPLAPIQSAQQLRQAKFMAQFLESHLRESLCRRFGGSQDLCLSFELPLYPSLDLTWIAVQFHASPKWVETVQRFLLEEIKQLSSQNPTPTELAFSWQQLKHKEELWHKDNRYWLTMLSDYFLRDWEWLEGRQLAKNEAPPTAEQLKQAMQQQLLFDRYTFIYTSP